MVVGPNCKRKLEAVKILQKISGWPLASAFSDEPTSASFIEHYQTPKHEIITESHFEYAAEQQYQRGINPFTFTEKKTIDSIAAENALIVLVSCKGSELVQKENDPGIQISPLEAIESLVLLYWTEANNVKHIIWETGSEKIIHKFLNKDPILPLLLLIS